MYKTTTIITFLLILLITSCSAITESSMKNKTISKGNTLNYFLFKDVSGQYLVKREKIENEKQ